MNIGICGYYGLGNFGDELFLKTFQQVFHEHRVFGYKGYIDHEQIDAVIVGGGDLITPYKFNNYYFPSQLGKIPTWVYGVGIVDFYPESSWDAEEVEKYRQIIQKAKATFFRDQNSVGIAKKLKFHSDVQHAPDVVFSYKQPNYPIIKPKSGNRIGVCIHAYESFPMKQVSTVLAELASEGYEIVCIPVVNQSNNLYADTEVCNSLCQAILKLAPGGRVDVVKPEYDLETTYSYIQNLDFLLSFKLHPSLVAIRNLVPVLCVSSMSKVHSLLKYFDLDAYGCKAGISDSDLRKQMRFLLQTGKQKMKSIHERVKECEAWSDKCVSELKKSIQSPLG
ncbi:polysaccharide pyruvyl transferase family protein [Thermoactinomyces sp. DSM 45892]|uniref:polysaccharide pyruvyl transferase family protein n=1 Tax=Thermoactinomyces sp. DSM 45892 TaxID=1882753 RepID=UPI000898BF7C|nr:polysaccharide pyruvyl transferase family protein [Thermoactinomyces sp. DSM 45892]SDY52164.1 Polysaccharide pyruvyl transferase family protein WcaK [Thermoactinomyces sp. DSM 45892]